MLPGEGGAEGDGVVLGAAASELLSGVGRGDHERHPESGGDKGRDTWHVRRLIPRVPRSLILSVSQILTNLALKTKTTAVAPPLLGCTVRSLVVVVEVVIHVGSYSGEREREAAAAAVHSIRPTVHTRSFVAQVNAEREREEGRPAAAPVALRRVRPPDRPSAAPSPVPPLAHMLGPHRGDHWWLRAAGAAAARADL